MADSDRSRRFRPRIGMNGAETSNCLSKIAGPGQNSLEVQRSDRTISQNQAASDHLVRYSAGVVRNWFKLAIHFSQFFRDSGSDCAKLTLVFDEIVVFRNRFPMLGHMDSLVLES